MEVNPYLNFKGQCEEAFTFYAQTFGGTIEAMIPHAGTPAAEHVGPDQQEKIMHARLKVGDAVFLGSDAPIQQYEKPAGFFVSLGIDQPAEADRVFGALQEGGQVVMPLERTFWAERFGMLIDRFGTPWMINCQGDTTYEP